MLAYVLRRLLLAIPLILVVSFLAFCLSRLAGGSYFDQFKTDRRYDPAQVRLWERQARLDAPLLVQYLHWLRGVCFDVRIQQPRTLLQGFEEPLTESAGLEAPADWTLQRTGDQTRGGIRSLRVRSGAAGRLSLPVAPAAVAGDHHVEIATFPETAAPLELGWRGAGAIRVDVRPGEWQAIELPAPPADAILEVSAPPGSRFYLDQLVAVEERLEFTAGRPDFGRSFYYDTPVFDLLKPNLVNSLILALATLVATWGIAIPVGTWCAVHRGRTFDKVASVLSFTGMSVPGFFLALLMLYFTVQVLGEGFGIPVLPVGSDRSSDYAQMSLLQRFGDRAWHLILPVFVLSAGAVASIQRVTRASVLEILRQNYVVTARAKGLPENKVIMRHALRNAINPLVTIFGYRLAELLSGAALVEIVFQYPGMGKFVLQATISRDLYVVMGSVFAGSLLLVVANLAADLALRAVDPRIEFGGGAR